VGEPSGPIQVPPLGLLGFLQLKSPQGRNPTWLEDTVQPTVDQFSMWMQARVDDYPAQSANLPTGTGGNVSWATPLIVPVGELWWVENYTVMAICAAGDSVTNITPAVRYNFLATSTFGRLGDAGSAGASERTIVSARGFWAQAGQELLFYYGKATSAGNITVLGYIHRTVLRI
jgi:hypothetical protein